MGPTLARECRMVAEKTVLNVTGLLDQRLDVGNIDARGVAALNRRAALPLEMMGLAIAQVAVAGVTVTMDGGNFYTVTSASGGYALPSVHADGSPADGSVSVHAKFADGTTADRAVTITSTNTPLGSYRNNVPWEVTGGSNVLPAFFNGAVSLAQGWSYLAFPNGQPVWLLPRRRPSLPLPRRLGMGVRPGCPGRLGRRVPLRLCQRRVVVHQPELWLSLPVRLHAASGALLLPQPHAARPLHQRSKVVF